MEGTGAQSKSTFDWARLRSKNKAIDCTHSISFTISFPLSDFSLSKFTLCAPIFAQNQLVKYVIAKWAIFMRFHVPLSSHAIDLWLMAGGWGATMLKLIAYPHVGVYNYFIFWYSSQVHLNYSPTDSIQSQKFFKIPWVDFKWRKKQKKYWFLFKSDQASSRLKEETRVRGWRERDARKERKRSSKI